MKLHGNARTCPKSRKLLVERIIEAGWSLTEAAAAASTGPQPRALRNCSRGYCTTTSGAHTARSATKHRPTRLNNLVGNYS
jgi:hypothetical protein